MGRRVDGAVVLWSDGVAELWGGGAVWRWGGAVPALFLLKPEVGLHRVANVGCQALISKFSDMVHHRTTDRFDAEVLMKKGEDLRLV